MGTHQTPARSAVHSWTVRIAAHVQAAPRATSPCMRPSHLTRAALLTLGLLASTACRTRATPAPLDYYPCLHGPDMPSGPPRVELDSTSPDSAGRLRGRVWDHSDDWHDVGHGRPLGGAQIFVHALGEPGRRVLAQAVADDSGYFTLSARLPDGRHERVARRIGFQTRTDTITVPMVPSHRMRIELVKLKTSAICRDISMR